VVGVWFGLVWVLVLWWIVWWIDSPRKRTGGGLNIQYRRATHAGTVDNSDKVAQRTLLCNKEQSSDLKELRTRNKAILLAKQSRTDSRTKPD